MPFPIIPEKDNMVNVLPLVVFCINFRRFMTINFDDEQ
jgi:hypothetical protein